MATDVYVMKLSDVRSDDTKQVGGKNASLGEMLANLKDRGIRVPEGFATTAHAYRTFLEQNNLHDRIKETIDSWESGKTSLQQAGKKIRRLFMKSSFPQDIAAEVQDAYAALCNAYQQEDVDIAARSSATAEDLPDASFAGQQETFLNVSGADEVLDACKRCYASLFTDRAIAYRKDKGFDQLKIALSVGVQKMVRSDKAGSGVMFTIDTETGFPDVIVINAAWGLGENVVQGAVTPDEYRVFKPLIQDDQTRPIIQKTVGEKEKKMVYARGGSSTTKNVDTPRTERTGFVLSDDEILQLARWAVAIESHYERPMDIEWAKDGETGKLSIVQARPETVQSQEQAGTVRSYTLKESGTAIVEGQAIGEAIAAGKAIVIKSPEERDRFEDNAILVTGMTDPDWVPIMKRAAGIVTDHGGRTSHAAIVSRELGLPALVGCGDATKQIHAGDEITLSCAEGQQGHVYEGILEYEEKEIDLDNLPDVDTQIMVNMASPAGALRWWQLPVKGIGLARMEFIINNVIKIHPLALVRYDELKDKDARKAVRDLTHGYDDKSEYFVDHLAQGIASMAAVQYPNPVIVRMSDFKTNEYAQLIGGEQFEPKESNPMLGFRGASRYYSERYRDGFALECKAIRRVRNQIGMRNVIVMIPFCRTVDEADNVLKVMAEEGLIRGQDGLEIYVMAEIPSNIILAHEFAERFDGFSIGTNDLTQLVLGIDRDSEELSELFDERNEAVKQTVAQLITEAHKKNRKVGICGQAPSDHPDFAEFLVRNGIDSISLNPDSVVDVIRTVHDFEKQQPRTSGKKRETADVT